MTVTIEVPMTLPSVANLREHWATKARRTKQQRDGMRTVCTLLLREFLKCAETRAVLDAARPTERIVATLTRVAPRTLDDDNLQGAFKALRDEVAAYFGLDDRDPRIKFLYAQAKGKPSCVRASFAVEAP